MLLSVSIKTITLTLLLIDLFVWKGLRIMAFTPKESTILSVIALVMGTLLGTAMRYGSHL